MEQPAHHMAVHNMVYDENDTYGYLHLICNTAVEWVERCDVK